MTSGLTLIVSSLKAYSVLKQQIKILKLRTGWQWAVFMLLTYGKWCNFPCHKKNTHCDGNYHMEQLKMASILQLQYTTWPSVIAPLQHAGEGWFW